MSLVQYALDRFQANMSRASIQTCSAWAVAYRIMGKPFPGPYTFKTHPWSKEMHDSKAEDNVGMKAAQMGFTETVLNICFYNIDILKQDVLYLLPNFKPDAANFSATRFDVALSLSPHLDNLFSDVQNVGLKRAGCASMFIRGTQSESGVKNVSTPLVILDEYEEMNQANIALAYERASGQVEGTVQFWKISTPGVFNAGIHVPYQMSSQNHFFFKCPGCSRFIELTYPDNIEIVGEDESDPRVYESYYKCKLCNKKLEHNLKADWLSLENGSHWVPSFTNKNAIGWQIPQLYSQTMSAGKFAITHFKALKSPSEEQQLWNSKMGLPHEVKGARVTDEELAQCDGEFTEVEGDNGHYVTMGVDQGKYLDCVISAWEFPNHYTEDINAIAIKKVLKTIRLQGADAFNQLDLLMFKYGVRHCVIDANPERRNAGAFANRFYGRVTLCFYGNNVKGKVINHNESANTITVDRTNWLDQSLGRFRNKTAQLPANLPRIVKDHLKNQVRKYEKDKNGNDVARYISTGDDHFGHAWTYDELALPMSLGIGITKTIETSMV